MPIGGPSLHSLPFDHLHLSVQQPPAASTSPPDQLDDSNDASQCGGLGANRKQRTVYHVWQIAMMEQAFKHQQYMVGSDRELLAVRLGLTESQVRWRIC